MEALTFVQSANIQPSEIPTTYNFQVMDIHNLKGWESICQSSDSTAERLQRYDWLKRSPRKRS